MDIENQVINDTADQVKQEIKTVVRETINDTVQTALEPIIKKLDSIQQVVDLARTEAEEQGRDISNMKITQSEHAAFLRELLEGVSKQTRSIVQKVSTSVEITMGEVGDKMQKKVKPAVQDTLNEFIETNKKKLKNKKRSFLPSWLRRN